jgi:hypothetical protein
LIKIAISEKGSESTWMFEFWERGISMQRTTDSFSEKSIIQDLIKFTFSSLDSQYREFRLNIASQTKSLNSHRCQKIMGISRDSNT